jgi:hypothetical protein
MKFITRQHILLHELSFNKQTNGQKEWHRLYGLPTYGVSVFASKLDNRNFFGNTFGIASFINFKLYTNSFFTSVFKLGLGLSYTEYVFSPEINYKNTALSTHTNAVILLHFNQTVKITEKFLFHSGAGLTHYSNGNTKKPNRGINIFSINAGLGYCIGKQNKIKYADSLLNKLPVKLFFLSSRAVGGIKEIYPPFGKKYKAFTWGVYGNYQSKHKTIWRAGIDYMFDESNADSFSNRNFSPRNPSRYNHRVGLFGSHLLCINNLQIETGWGIYLFDHYKLDGNHYQRIGLNYNIKNNFLLNLTLKTHFANADYIEWGIIYQFKKYDTQN